MDRDEVKNLFGLDKIYIEAFFNTCPFTLSSLRNQKKEQPLIFYRQLGLFWIWLSGETLEQTGLYFNKHHTTVLHSIENVIIEKNTTYLHKIEKLLLENKNLSESNNDFICKIMGSKFAENQTKLISKVNLLEDRLLAIGKEITLIKKEL
jgi:hypothetical protein